MKKGKTAKRIISTFRNSSIQQVTTNPTSRKNRRKLLNSRRTFRRVSFFI